jgi:hypothetical protein
VNSYKPLIWRGKTLHLLRHCWHGHVTLPHSCVIQVFATHHGSARRKQHFVYCCVIAGACFDVTVVAWRKYATILKKKYMYKTDTVLSYWRCLVAIPWNLQNDAHISASTLEALMCHCSRRLFSTWQPYTHGLLKCLIIFTLLAPCDLLRAQTSGNLKGPSLDHREDVEHTSQPNFSFGPDMNISTPLYVFMA